MAEERYWTRERIIAAIQQWARDHGKPPTFREWQKRAGVGALRPSTSTIRRWFPTFADAIEAAGFPRPLHGGPVGGETYDDPVHIENRIRKQNEREDHGATVTYGHGVDRAVRVYAHAPKAALVHRIVADCGDLGDGWRILSISTPQSIYSDLQGRTHTFTGAHTVTPEAQFVGRSHHDLLAPNLLGPSLQSERLRDYARRGRP